MAASAQNAGRSCGTDWIVGSPVLGLSDVDLDFPIEVHRYTLQYAVYFNVTGLYSHALPLRPTLATRPRHLS